MNFNEKTQQFVFPTKEAAQWFAQSIKALPHIRLSGRVAVRVSLPEFRHGSSPGFSVFWKGLGLMDTNDSIKRARQDGGRRWGEIK